MNSFRKVGIVAAAAALATLTGTQSTFALSTVPVATVQVTAPIASVGVAAVATRPSVTPPVAKPPVHTPVVPAPVVDGPPAWHKQSCTVDYGPVHFRTPAKAMRYLAAAWNCGDVRAMRRVTNPASRDALRWMTREAVNLHLVGCKDYGQAPGYHAFECTFTHDYPKGVPHETPNAAGKGQAFLSVRPAGRPGWYATVVGCG